MEIGARVHRRTQNVIDGELADVDFPAIEVQLIPALVVFAIAPDHLEVSAGRIVIEAVFGGVVFDGVFRTRAREGAAHPGLKIFRVDRRVAPEAELCVDVAPGGRVRGCSGFGIRCLNHQSEGDSGQRGHERGPLS
jgi:hypothetical protein